MFILRDQCLRRCRSYFVELEPTDGFVRDARCGNVVAGPFASLEAAKTAATKLNDYVEKTTGTRPFFAYKPE
jgi:hypothetical protein